jgi:putative glutamine amidotransferase
MSERPVIGIATYIERARWGAWDAPAHLLPRDYADSVQRAGGMALLLPPDPELTADPGPVLALLDGLILAGGADIDPATYGQDRHPATDAGNRERDDFELALARAAVEADLPLLAICRGMQVLNVARGGTLHQDLPESQGHGEHRRSLGSFEGSDHQVHLAPDSLAREAAGEADHHTLSHHHQGLDALGEGLKITGTSDHDEVPEAVELPGCSFVLGVQWHPEADPHSNVIGRFVAAAASRPTSR